jgi:micrococcal nuclease
MWKRLRRKSLKITLFAIFLFLAWSAAAFADFSGKVVAVKDGDTLEVMKERVAVRVRLYGIDCPEKGQAFGQRAKQFASDLAFGKTVRVIEKDRDRYGRTVGEVILEDGRSLNHELVRAGLAWWYRQYAKKDAELEMLERDARKAKAGLWADVDPVPPWNWRKERRPK